MVIPIPGSLGAVGNGHLDPIQQLAMEIKELKAQMNASLAAIANGYSVQQASQVASSANFTTSWAPYASVSFAVPPLAQTLTWFLNAEGAVQSPASGASALQVGLNYSTTGTPPATPSSYPATETAAGANDWVNSTWTWSGSEPVNPTVTTTLTIYAYANVALGATPVTNSGFLWLNGVLFWTTS